MKMKKDNVLLMEKHDIVTNNAVVDNNKIVMVKGIRVFRVVEPTKHGFKTIAQYDHDKDFIDLSALHKYKNYFLCSVDINDYNKKELIWNCCQIDNGADDSTIFNIKNNRRCTEKEIKLLDSVFVDFYNEANRRYQAKLKKEAKVTSQIVDESFKENEEDND